MDFEIFPSYNPSLLKTLARDKVTEELLGAGMWPTIRQRPFSQIAHPNQTPKSIFIHAMNTEPLAADVDFVLNGKEDLFQAGLDVLTRLTPGKVYLCVSPNAKSKALTKANNVEIHQFSGPHPAGNVSTHIHCVDPLNKGDLIWYVEAQDVVRIGNLFVNGVSLSERIVAITGEGAPECVYKKTIIGAPISHLLGTNHLPGMRCIAGSVLSGRIVGLNGFIGPYDSQMTVIPEGGKRHFLGWLAPGFNAVTFSSAFASSFLPAGEASVNTDKHGSDRAIVLNHIYDQYVPLDIFTYFLIKAVMVGDIDEMEKLGILECDEEDFALASFACPSKTDVGGIIRKGLNLIEKEEEVNH